MWCQQILGGGGGGSGSGTVTSVACANGTITTTGTCAPISGATTNVLPKAASATTLTNSSVSDNGTMVSTTEPIQAPSFTSSDAAHSGLSIQNGKTSGTVATGVLDIAGTAIVYVWPSTNGTAGQVLVDTGSTTCPTYAAGAPATCHLMAWQGVPNPAVTITTGTTATLSTPYTFNQEATAATAVAYTLPTASAGAQYCVDNSYNGSAANTGVLTVNASASGQFIIFTDGSLSATGGNLTSGGAARDGGCFTGIDATHWMFYPHSPSGGTWAKH